MRVHKREGIILSENIHIYQQHQNVSMETSHALSLIQLPLTVNLIHWILGIVWLYFAS